MLKRDDSRRISLLAEKLLSEFEQTHTPSINRGPPLSKPIVEPEPETADVGGESSLTVPIPTIETESPLAREETSLPEVENLSIPVDRPSGSQELVFDRLFRREWTRTTLAAVLFSFVFYWYNYSNYTDDDPLIVLEFVTVAGLSSLIQWFVFRDRLKMWWVGTNTIAGFALGLLHTFLYGIAGLDWWSLHLVRLLAVWLVGNFTVGRRLAGET